MRKGAKQRFLFSRLVAFMCASVLLAASLVFAACGGGGGGDGDTIKVGSLLSVTGPAALVGDKMRKGLTLAIDEINADGGVDGKELELVFFDPAGDTSKAVEQTRRLLTREQVDVVVGGGSQSGIALAMAPILDEGNVLFMATEGAREIVQPASERPKTFKATFNDTAIIERTIDFWKQRDVRNVGFLPDTSGFGQSALEVMREDAPKAGLRLSVESFDPLAQSLTPQLTNISRTPQDTYLAWTTTPAGVVFMRNAEQLGLSDDALIQHGFGFVDDRLMKQGGEAAVGAILTSPKVPVWDQLPDADPQKEVLERFVEGYREKYDEPPNVFAGQTYDGMKLVAAGIEQAGTTDAEELAKALEELKPQVGVTGVFDFTSQDHSGLAADDAVMIEWTGDRFELAGAEGE